MQKMYERDCLNVLIERITEANNPLLQFIVGPRQTGKTTMYVQALEKLSENQKIKSHVVSSDDQINPTSDWLKMEWQQARNMTSPDKPEERVVFIVDEVQKIPHWARVVKGLYDQDRRNQTNVKVILTGSSSLLLQKGIEDSLMGRFEIIRSTHWNYKECKEAFAYSLNDYLYLGGYPGVSIFKEDETRWRTYVRDAIIEPVLSRDILEVDEIRKPALMRNLFYLSATYSGQELSYNKMLGQLQEAGSAVTVSSYLNSLQKANMVATLMKFNKSEIRKRASSPRLMVFDTSLMNACMALSRKQIFELPSVRGHLVESAVGARLLARSITEGFEVNWWREGIAEVDFVISCADKITAIEVKSGNTKKQGGMSEFLAKYPEAKRIVVGGSAQGACTLEDFLLDRVELF